ncbi:MAG: hypothetical protein Q4A07_02015 [Coriobacteriales bacterium]|nr:hypothetical protein [Coriobacteriales bacterium]
MKYSKLHKAIAIIVSAHLVLSLVPAEGLASELERVDAAAQAQEATETAGDEKTVEGLASGEQATSDSVTDSPAPKEPEQDPAATQSPTYPAFAREATIGEARILAKADEGVFPQKSDLVVREVTEERLESAQKAVREAREAEQDAGEAEREVSASHAYEVRVEAADSSELEPKDNHEVELAFLLPEAANKTLRARVYQLTDEPDEREEQGSRTVATMLEVTQDWEAGTVTVKTNKLTYYVVEFVKEDQQEVLEAGDASPPADVQEEEKGQIAEADKPQDGLAANDASQNAPAQGEGDSSSKASGDAANADSTVTEPTTTDPAVTNSTTTDPAEPAPAPPDTAPPHPPPRDPKAAPPPTHRSSPHRP